MKQYEVIVVWINNLGVSLVMAFFFILPEDERFF